MARAMNFRLAEVAHGRAVFHGAPLFEHMNPTGAVHGGWYGTLLDSCMGCAVMTALPGARLHDAGIQGEPPPRDPPGTAVIATGTVTHAGRSTAVASGEIRDAGTDRLFASGTTTCIIMGR
jgi:acyl-coenzyme A thioesterase PaaI-like protein